MPPVWERVITQKNLQVSLRTRFRAELMEGSQNTTEIQYGDYFLEAVIFLYIKQDIRVLPLSIDIYTYFFVFLRRVSLRSGV